MIWRSSATERMIGIGEWRRPKEFPKGASKMVSSGTLSSLFINNSTYTSCSSSYWPQLPGPTHHYHHSLLPPPLSATKLSWCWSSGFKKIKTPLIEYLAAVRLKERNADKETWEAASITVACEEPAQQWNCCPIDASKPTPQAPPSSDISVPGTTSFLSASLPKPRSSLSICWATRYRQNFFQSKYSLCSQSSILTHLFWWYP